MPRTVMEPNHCHPSNSNIPIHKDRGHHHWDRHHGGRPNPPHSFHWSAPPQTVPKSCSVWPHQYHPFPEDYGVPGNFPPPPTPLVSSQSDESAHSDKDSFVPRPPMEPIPSHHHHNHHHPGFNAPRPPYSNIVNGIPNSSKSIPSHRHALDDVDRSNATQTVENASTNSNYGILDSSQTVSSTKSKNCTSPLPNNEFDSELQPNDIVIGRGAPALSHPGNQAFHDLVKRYQTTYLCANRSDKPQVALELLDVIHSRGGRFVRRVATGKGSGYEWEDIGEKRAYQKVCQALRDGAPELQRQMMSTSKKREMLDTYSCSHIICTCLNTSGAKSRQQDKKHVAEVGDKAKAK